MERFYQLPRVSQFFTIQCGMQKDAYGAEKLQPQLVLFPKCQTYMIAVSMHYRIVPYWNYLFLFIFAIAQSYA